MIRNLLLAVILTFSLIASNTTAKPTQSYGHVEKNPQIYGLLKVYIDHKDNIAMSRSTRLNANTSHTQSRDIIGNHYQQYRLLETPKQKALFTYQFLLKVAKQADFGVHVYDDGKSEKYLFISIHENNLHGGFSVDLIPAQDMESVFPLLLQLIKNTKQSTDLAQLFQPLIHIKMPPLNNNWFEDEWWYSDWERWVNREMMSMCYTSDGERLCSYWGTHYVDIDGDDIPDEVCGRYGYYHGSSEDRFHCAN